MRIISWIISFPTHTKFLLESGILEAATPQQYHRISHPHHPSKEDPLHRCRHKDISRSALLHCRWWIWVFGCNPLEDCRESNKDDLD
ncbi:hypothetical protein JB92DRAFT_3043664 [Gautieria morchelliformis]|nr:hypothetical protein JB92DRAFT_3043664 [Gautieria morchelliformis]